MSAHHESPVAGSNPVTELREFLAASVARFRALRQYLPVIRTQVAEDIVADVVTRDGTIANCAYSAEQHDLEALKLIAQAERPDSDGGRSITPREAARIVRLIRLSAEKSRTVSELATP